MLKNEELKSYWITVPGKKYGSIGIGVTAYSTEDAFALMENSGYNLHLEPGAKVMQISSSNELDQSHVIPNMGPMTFRGVWYPCSNIGFGASGQ